VEEHDLGVAAAAQRMMFQVGSALGITVMISVYGGTGQASDFFNGYAVGSVLGIAAIVFSWFIRSTPRHPGADPDEVSAETAVGATPPAAPVSVSAGDGAPTTPDRGRQGSTEVDEDVARVDAPVAAHGVAGAHPVPPGVEDV